MKDLYHAINALNNIVNEEPPRGRQDGPAALKPAAVAPKPKINPAVPAAGPVRANPINPQAMAATKAAASVVNAPKMSIPTPKPAAPAPRAKVKATAANTKDYDKTVALQKKLGVTADGIMGPQTRAAMAAAAAKKPATPASQVTPTAGDPGSQQSASPAPTGTARKVSTVAPGAAPAAADDMMSPDDMMMQPARVAKSNAALAGDVEKVKKAGGGILDKIGAGISSLFKPSDRSVIGKRQAAAQAAPAAAEPKLRADLLPDQGKTDFGLDRPDSGPNSPGSNFATAADGSISRTDNPRQPGDAAPTTRTANRFDRARARMDKARDRKAARGDTTPVSVSDVQNAAAQSRAAVAATAAAPTTRTVRQRVTDPNAKAALLSKVNRAREMQRLALAAGSTDPDDIRAYQRRMANTQGTGAAGGPIN